MNETYSGRSISNMNSSDSNSSSTDLSYDGATIQLEMAPSLKEVRKNSMKRLGNSNSSLSESNTSTHNLSVSANKIIFKKPLFKKQLNLNLCQLNDSASSSDCLPKTLSKNASIKNRKKSLHISQCLENSLNDSSSEFKIGNISKCKSKIVPAKKSLSSSALLETSLTENVINLKGAISRQKENRKSLKLNCSSFEKSASPAVEGSFGVSHSSGNGKTWSPTIIETEQRFCDKDVGLLSLADGHEPSGVEIEVNAVDKIKQFNSTTINSKSDTGVLQCEFSQDKSCIDQAHSYSDLSCNLDKVCDGGKSNDKSNVIDSGAYSPKTLHDHQKGADETVQELKTTSNYANINEGKEVAMENSASLKPIHDNSELYCELAETDAHTKMSAHNLNTTYTMPTKNSCLNVTYTVSEDHPKMSLDRSTDNTEIVSDKNLDEDTETNYDEKFVNESNFDICDKMKNCKKKIVMKSLKSLSDSSGDLDRTVSVPERGLFGINKKIGRKSLHLSKVCDISQPSKFDDTTPLRSDRKDTDVVSMVKQQIIGTTVSDRPGSNILADTPDLNESCHNLIETNINAQNFSSDYNNLRIASDSQLASCHLNVTATEEQEKYLQNDFEITSSQESTNDVKNIFKKNIIGSRKSLVLNYTSMENTVEETLKECIKKRRGMDKRSLEATDADLLSLPVDKTLVENGELSKCLTDNSVFLQPKNENTDATNNGEINNDNIFVQAEGENILVTETGETDCYNVSVQADDGDKLATKNSDIDHDNILIEADKGDILATNTDEFDHDNISERVIDENIHAAKSDVMIHDNIQAENEDIPCTKNGEIDRDNILLETENPDIFANNNGEIDHDNISKHVIEEDIHVIKNDVITHDNLQAENEDVPCTKNGEIDRDNILLETETENEGILANNNGEIDHDNISKHVIEEDIHVIKNDVITHDNIHAENEDIPCTKNCGIDRDNILLETENPDIFANNNGEIDHDNISKHVIEKDIHVIKNDVITDDNIDAEKEDIPCTKNGEIDRDNILLETENPDIFANNNGEIDHDNISKHVIEEDIHVIKNDVITHDNIDAEKEDILCTKNGEIDRDNILLETENPDIFANNNGEIDHDNISKHVIEEDIHVIKNDVITHDNLQAENEDVPCTKNGEIDRDNILLETETENEGILANNNGEIDHDNISKHVIEEDIHVIKNDEITIDSDANINLNFSTDSLVDEKNVTNKSLVVPLVCDTTSQATQTKMLQNNSENTINREPVKYSSQVLDSEDSFENNCSLEISRNLKVVFKNKIRPRKSLHLNNSSLKNSVDESLKKWKKKKQEINRCSQVAFKRVDAEEILNRNQDYVCADVSQENVSYCTDKCLSEKRGDQSVIQNPPERPERSVHFTGLESENIVPTRDETISNNVSVDKRPFTRKEMMPKKLSIEKSDSLTTDRCILNTQTLSSTDNLRNTSSSRTANDVEEIAVTNEVIRENSSCSTDSFLECCLKKDFENEAIYINKTAHEFVNNSLTDALVPINITSTSINVSGKDREMLVCEGSNSNLKLLSNVGNNEPVIEPCDDPVIVTSDSRSSNENISVKRSSSYEKSLMVSTSLTEGDNSCHRKPDKNVSKKRRTNSSAVVSPSDEKINEKDVKVSLEDKSSRLAAASKDTISVRDISSYKGNKSYSDDLSKNTFKVPNCSPINVGRKRSDHCQEKFVHKEMATAGPSINDQSLNWTVDVSRIPAEVKRDYNLRSRSHSTPLPLKNTASVTNGNTDKLKKSKKKKSVTFANSYVNPVNISTPVDSCNETDAPLMNSLTDVSVICGEGLQVAGRSGMKPKSSTPNPKRRFHERSKNNNLREKPVDAGRKSSSESNISIPVGPRASDDVTLPRRGRSSRTNSNESDKRTSLTANSRAEMKSSDELAVNESKKNRSVQVSKTYVLSSSNFSSETSSISKTNKIPNKSQTMRCIETSVQKLNYDRVEDDTFLETSVEFPPKKKPKTCSLTKFNSKEDRSIVSSGSRSSVKGERALKTITNVGNYLRESFSTVSIDDSVHYQTAKRPRLETTTKSFSRKSIRTDSNNSFNCGGNSETNEKSYFSNDDGLPLGYSISDEEECPIQSYDRLKRNHPWLPSLIWEDTREQDKDRCDLTFRQSSLLSTFQPLTNRPKNIKIKFPKKKMAKPAPWANKSFYKYLFETLKPIYGIKHKKESEDFVLFLHPYVESVKLLKNKKDYSNFVLIIKEKTKEIGLCKDIWDFWEFCQFLPYEFKAKAIEIGNARYDSVIAATDPF